MYERPDRADVVLPLLRERPRLVHQMADPLPQRVVQPLDTTGLLATPTMVLGCGAKWDEIAAVGPDERPPVYGLSSSTRRKATEAAGGVALAAAYRGIAAAGAAALAAAWLSCP